MTSERLKICFCIGPSSAELRDYSEQVFEFVISEAAEAFDYRPVRASQITDSTMSPQVIQHLTQDALVIADLTGQSSQVYYGLAVRHAARKHVILLLRDGEPSLPEFADLPFLRISIASARDAKRCKQELMAQIEALEHTTEPQDSPITRALKRQLFEQSESLLDQRAADMLKQLDSVGNVVNGIDERISQPENLVPPEIFKLLEGIRSTVSILDERLSQPEMLLPHDHVLSTIKNSGMLLNRDDVDQLMREIFSEAEDAKNILNNTAPQLNKLVKNLNNVTVALNKPRDPAELPDVNLIASQIGENTTGIKEAQDSINEAAQKLDNSLGTLSQLYRNLSKLTI
jgi:hypothetical protein